MKSLAQVPKVPQQRRASNTNVLDFRVHSPNLADAFIALTGRHLRANVLRAASDVRLNMADHPERGRLLLKPSRTRCPFHFADRSWSPTGLAR